MPDGEKPGLELSWWALLIAIPSFAVFEFNDQLLKVFGAASSPRPAILTAFQNFTASQSHLESGARLEFLAAIILFAAVAVAMMVAAIASLWALSASARIRIAIGATALTAAAVIMMHCFPTPGIPGDIRLPDCFDKHVNRLPERAAAACSVPIYVGLVRLLDAWKWVLIVATAAVILGTICCLAEAAPGSARRAQIALLKRQAKRLNLFLYLSAMLMVSSLLVQNAFLRWPRFAVPELGAFDGHVSAIILYYGVGYSVFLASFYLPVAFWLGWRAEKLKDGKLRDEILEAATTGSTGVAKSAAAILAPALAGLLSAWIDLPG